MEHWKYVGGGERKEDSSSYCWTKTAEQREEAEKEEGWVEEIRPIIEKIKLEVEKEFNFRFKNKKWSKGGGDRMKAFYELQDEVRLKYSTPLKKEAETKTGEEKEKLLFWSRII